MTRRLYNVHIQLYADKPPRGARDHTLTTEQSEALKRAVLRLFCPDVIDPREERWRVQGVMVDEDELHAIRPWKLRRKRDCRPLEHELLAIRGRTRQIFEAEIDRVRRDIEAGRETAPAISWMEVIRERILDPNAP